MHRILFNFLWAILSSQFFFSAASASTSTAQISKFSVKFDRSFFYLEVDNKKMIYRESDRTYEIKIEPCNRKVVNQLISSYRSMLTKHLSSKQPASTTKYDVVINSGMKSYSVPRGSDFGTWLRNLPKKMPYLYAQARVSCKKR